MSTSQVSVAKQRIVVYASGGVVQDVRGVPAGVEVAVHDYDVDDADEDGLEHDADGAYSEMLYPVRDCVRGV